MNDRRRSDRAALTSFVLILLAVLSFVAGLVMSGSLPLILSMVLSLLAALALGVAVRSAPAKPEPPAPVVESFPNAYPPPEDDPWSAWSLLDAATADDDDHEPDDDHALGDDPALGDEEPADYAEPDAAADYADDEPGVHHDDDLPLPAAEPFEKPVAEELAPAGGGGASEPVSGAEHPVAARRGVIRVLPLADRPATRHRGGVVPGPSPSLAIDDYDRLSAKEIISVLELLDAGELREVRGYEQDHAGRVTVLRRLDALLQPLGGTA